jgi:hypothetical protein
MTNYVPSIPDCERWKKYISNLAKGRKESTLNSYVKSASPLGEIKVISPVEGDLAIVKSRVSQYKKRVKQASNQTRRSGAGVKTSVKGKGQTTTKKTKGKGKKSTPVKQKSRKGAKNKGRKKKK